ncbi:tyrosine-type recombinase/integrase [Lacticaseibacillus saniviri]|uniref:Prophage Lp2 protein 2, integrase n=3 Tax=Lacticaseibacillus saniviri TaxID=931533 RepID=A0A0R2MSE1_9LACO|nr:tyrosine-type recombinase/integrase [Lacticaseibacillus saniviri]KRO15136.1 prophage Lp2 protein 2, integrase [Lacticaseibacillus saniviri JCM 17471 = DSM 24301]
MFETEKEANLWLAELSVSVAHGKKLVAERMLFSDYFWQAYQVFKRRSVAATTEDTYRYTLRYIKKVLPKVTMRDLNRSLIQGFFNALSDKLSHETQRKMLSQIRSVLADAVDDGVLPHNPARRITLVADPNRTKKPDAKFMSREDFFKIQTFLFDYKYRLSDVNRMALFVITQAGLRAGECLALRDEDLDYESNTISVTRSYDSLHETIKEPKTPSSIRQIQIAPEAMLVIHKWSMEHRKWLFQRGIPNPENLLFLNNQGELPRSRGLNAAYHQLQIRLGIEAKYSTHTIRHTLASLMLDNKINIAYISKFLGHSSVQITQQYYLSMLPDRMEQEALKAINVTSIAK